MKKTKGDGWMQGTPVKVTNRRKTAQIVKPKLQYAMFDCLALGTRFSYIQCPEYIWVKLDSDRVAKWSDHEIDSKWYGQPICSASDTGKDFKVILREQGYKGQKKVI